ncbi:hypothetical protein QTN25_008323 [Entamoeba marina]
MSYAYDIPSYDFDNKSKRSPSETGRKIERDQTQTKYENVVRSQEQLYKQQEHMMDIKRDQERIRYENKYGKQCSPSTNSPLSKRLNETSSPTMTCNVSTNSPKENFPYFNYPAPCYSVDSGY